VEFKDDAWKPAAVLGDLGMEPWSFSAFESSFTAAVGMYGMVRSSLVTADTLTMALGRPNREQVVTSRASVATTLQGLELTNGNELAKIFESGAIRRMGMMKDADLVDWIYLQALGRKPTTQEAQLASQIVGSPVKKEGVADLMWAVTMLPEYQLIY
jgi:hypothetical protein